jgi:trimethylamine:corrinoid methyltransferase-like protein
VRPRLQFLDESLIERIISEALDLLGTLGMKIGNDSAVALLADHGGAVDRESGRVTFPESLVMEAIAKAPSGFALYDVLGNQTQTTSCDSPS